MAPNRSPSPTDSLSSLGTSTEPLPASDDRAILSPSQSPVQSRNPGKSASKGKGKAGEESDSSLTEQSSSQGEERRGRKPAKGKGKGKAKAQESEEEEDEDEEDEEEDATPSGNKRAAQVRMDESDEEASDEEVTAGAASGSRSASLSELEDEEEEVKEEDDDEDEEEATPEPPERLRPGSNTSAHDIAMNREYRGSRVASKAAKDEDDDEEVEEETVVEDVEEVQEQPRAVAPPRGRGGRGRGRGRGNPTFGRKKPVVVEAISSVPSRASSYDSSHLPTLPSNPAANHSPTSSSPHSTSTSAVANNTIKRPRSAHDSPSPSASEHVALAGLSSLAAPSSGLLSLPIEEGTHAVLLQLERAVEDEANHDDGETDHRGGGMDVDEEEEEEERERAVVVEKSYKKMKKSKLKGKKDVKGKGRAVVVEVDEDTEGGEGEGDGEGLDTPAGSDHEEDTSDAVFLRKRADAMEALTRIEIEFARLRDKLYLERLADIEKERMGIETHTHPELLHLTQLIELRRGTKLDMAQKCLDGLVATYERRREADEHTAWNWWSDGRAELRTTMLDEANAKRRKLDREKRFIDRPQEGGLTPLLIPRALPQVPLQHRRRLGFEPEPEMMTEMELAWSLRHDDVRTEPGVGNLDDDSAWNDLERMGLREPSRHPAPYPYDSGYGQLNSGGMGHYDGRMAGSNPLAPPYTYGSAFDPSGLSLQHQQHHFNQNLPSLPPLPVAHPPRAEYASRDHTPSRTPASPSRSFAQKEAAASSHRANGTSTPGRMANFAGGSPFGPGPGVGPSPYPDMDVDRPPQQHQLPPAGGWHKGAPQATHYQFDDPRRAPGGGAGLAESLDIVAGHQLRRSIDEGGKLDVNGKVRLTLDDHMVGRSPKAAPAAGVVHAKGVQEGRNHHSSPAFMAIPAFVPHHSQHAQLTSAAHSRTTSPAPAVPIPSPLAAPSIKVVNSFSPVAVAPPTVSAPAVVVPVAAVKVAVPAPVEAFPVLDALPELPVVAPAPVVVAQTAGG